MERLFSRAFLARKVTFSLGMVEWLSETSSELKTTLTKKNIPGCSLTYTLFSV